MNSFPFGHSISSFFSNLYWQMDPKESTNEVGAISLECQDHEQHISAHTAHISKIEEESRQSIPAYTAVVKFPTKDISYFISCLAEEKLLVGDLLKFCSETRQSVVVEGVVSSMISCIQSPEEKKRLLRFEEQFESTKLYTLCLGLKILSKETLDEDRMKMTYSDGTVEVIKTFNTPYCSYKEVKRTHSDGTIEMERIPSWGKNDKIYCFQKGEYTFYNIEKLYPTFNEGKYNFVELEGQLIPIQKNPGSLSHSIYKGDPIQVLEQLICLEFGSQLVSKVLNHPSNLIEAESFLKHLAHQEDENPSLLFKLPLNSLYEVLKIAFEKRIKLNFSQVDPSTGLTLFSKCVCRNRASLVKLMMKLDPEVVKEHASSLVKYFTRSALMGFKKEASIFLKAIQELGIKLSDEDQWIQRTFLNQDDFDAVAYLQLRPKTQKKIFRLANIYMHDSLIERLQAYPIPFKHYKIKEPYFLKTNQNGIQVRTSIIEFFANLRKKNCLFTQAEFDEQCDLSKFILKYQDIGRIQGRDRLERVAQESGIQRIKVPKKIAVIIDSENPVEIEVHPTVTIQSKSFNVFAERIIPVERNISREEADELVTLLGKSHYYDIGLDNVLVAEDGIYIIDTEISSFSAQPSYGKMDCFLQLLNVEDREWFFEFLQEKIKTYQANFDEKKSALLHEQKRVNLKNFGFLNRGQNFKFKLDL